MTGWPPDIRNYFSRDNKMKGDNKMSKGLKKFKVSEIFEKKSGFINPVIVNFQNGELNEKHASKCSVTLTANDNGWTDVEVKTSSGQVFKDSNCSEKSRPKQILAIRNKKTNKVRLVEVDHAILINSALLSLPKAVEPPPTSASQFRILNQTFGGKKIMVRLEARDKLNLSSLPIANDVRKAVEDTKVEENISLNNTETESILYLLPPCHRDARELADVYKIDEILSEVELQALLEEVSKVNELLEGFSQFSANCYSQVKHSKQNLELRLAGILFIETLIKFLRTPSKKLMMRNMNVCSFSSVIQNKILNEFCIKTETSVTRPMTMRDKSLCYIIALCLICCNHQINLKLLAKVTSVHLKRLSRLAQVVGAVPHAKEEGLFILKIPLPALPKSSKGKIQRK